MSIEIIAPDPDLATDAEVQEQIEQALDDFEPAAQEISVTVVAGRLRLTASTHWAIRYQRAVYYPSASDTPTSEAAFADIPARILRPVGVS